ncbi:hypothetical protein JBKA6_0888 [Ichthyobacterium seriolicida]|uniref:Uncharacterized protein n=1 Tax=Ichthyobacterium seriolicida TaxID=242600 RepID=A0A1J1E1S2_9FLAO|nr:hypothetical protein JBKA6_0888 [Ichthyobacterium seriolicida]
MRLLSNKLMNINRSIFSKITENNIIPKASVNVSLKDNSKLVFLYLTMKYTTDIIQMG